MSIVRAARFSHGSESPCIFLVIRALYFAGMRLQVDSAGPPNLSRILWGVRNCFI